MGKWPRMRLIPRNAPRTTLSPGSEVDLGRVEGTVQASFADHEARGNLCLASGCEVPGRLARRWCEKGVSSVVSWGGPRNAMGELPAVVIVRWSSWRWLRVPVWAVLEVLAVPVDEVAHGWLQLCLQWWLLQTNGNTCYSNMKVRILSKPPSDYGNVFTRAASPYPLY